MNEETGRRLWAKLHLQPVYEGVWLNTWINALAGTCKQKTQKFVFDNPPTLDNWEQFKLDLHNSVNRELGKPEWTLTQAQLYWANIQPEKETSPMPLQPTNPTVLPNGPEQYYWRMIGDNAFPPTGAVENRLIQLVRVKANTDGTNPMQLPPNIDIPLIGTVNGLKGPAPAATGQPPTPEQVCLDEMNASVQKLIAAKKK